MTIFEAARSHMIESQLRPNKVTDDRVLNAFAGIRRELFVPEHLRPVAYIDEDLPLGGGRYLMEPMVAARLLQAAAIARTGRRADRRRRNRIRSGSGRNARAECHRARRGSRAGPACTRRSRRARYRVGQLSSRVRCTRGIGPARLTM